MAPGYQLKRQGPSGMWRWGQLSNVRWKLHSADALLGDTLKLKPGIRVKVEHLFRVIKRQSGNLKARYRGLRKNTGQLTALIALTNL